MKIIFYKRIIDPYFSTSIEVFKKKSASKKGIQPEFCPAIRDFYSRGWLVGTPIEINLYNSREFDVDKRSTPDGKLFLSPGIIGDPNADRLYARIDTGLSLKDLPVALMAIKRQSEDWKFKNIVIPPVIYPRGYSGPILIAVSSDHFETIPINEPLIHLIPMTEETHIEAELSNENISHEKFEGLYTISWEKDYVREGIVKSTSLLS